MYSVNKVHKNLPNSQRVARQVRNILSLSCNPSLATDTKTLTRDEGNFSGHKIIKWRMSRREWIRSISLSKHISSDLKKDSIHKRCHLIFTKRPRAPEFRVSFDRKLKAVKTTVTWQWGSPFARVTMRPQHFFLSGNIELLAGMLLAFPWLRAPAQLVGCKERRSWMHRLAAAVCGGGTAVAGGFQQNQPPTK